MKNKLSTVKNIVIFIYNCCYFYLQLSVLIQHKTKYCNIKAFYQSRVGSYNQWNYFQLRCIDKRWSGDFSVRTGLYTFRSLIASKNYEVWSSLHKKKPHTHTLILVFIFLFILNLDEILGQIKLTIYMYIYHCMWHFVNWAMIICYSSVVFLLI